MSAKIIIEESILRELYETKNLNKVQIAKHLSISITAITRLFKEYGIVGKRANRDSHEYKHWSKYTSLEKPVLEELYVTQGKSITKIALELGINQMSIRKYLKMYGLHRPKKLLRNFLTKEELLQLYDVQRLTPDAIGLMFDMTQSAVYSTLKYYNIKKRNMSEALAGKPSGKKIKLPNDEIIDLYVNQGMGSVNIAKKYNVSSTTIIYRLKELGIDRRPREIKLPMDEITKIYETGKHKIYEIADMYNVHGETMASKLTKHGVTLRRKDIAVWRKYEQHKPSYNTFRTKMYQLDNFTCKLCNKLRGKLELHHIDHVVHNPELFREPNNVITLCKDCHKLYGTHHGMHDEHFKKCVSMRDEYIGLTSEEEAALDSDYVENYTIDFLSDRKKLQALTKKEKSRDLKIRKGLRLFSGLQTDREKLNNRYMTVVVWWTNKHKRIAEGGDYRAKPVEKFIGSLINRLKQGKKYKSSTDIAIQGGIPFILEITIVGKAYMACRWIKEHENIPSIKLGNFTERIHGNFITSSRYRINRISTNKNYDKVINVFESYGLANLLSPIKIKLNPYEKEQKLRANEQRRITREKNRKASLINIEEFITRSNKIHSSKYDYSLVEINHMNDVVDIICPHHGKFKQQVKAHLKGRKCTPCSHGNLTLEQFIASVNKVHNNKYDYSQVTEYKDTSTIISIICPIHGLFEQKAITHKIGRGCNKCGIDRTANACTLSQDEYLDRCREVHGDRYDYSKVEYVNSNTKITIKCHIHGEFLKNPNKHINEGEGCKTCAFIESGKRAAHGNYTFIKKSREKHGDKYDYSKVEYVNAHTKVIIGCPVHGEFSQMACSHYKGMACMKCSRLSRKKQ